MSTTPITLAEIRENLTGYTEHLAQRDAVKAEIARRQSLSAGVNPYEDAGARELREMLEAGESLDGLDQRIAARMAVEQASVAAGEALTGLRSQLDSELAGIQNDAGSVFPMLNAALETILAELTTLEPLREILTPEATLASRRTDDHERLSTLLAQITGLRSEQSRIMRATADEWGGKYSILRVIRNPADVFDDCAIWLSPGHLVHRTRNEQKQIAPPWPTPLNTAVLGAEFTLWCLRHKADQWIPSPSEFDAAAAELRAKASAPRTDRRTGDWIDPGPGRHTPARSLGRGRDRKPAHVIN